MQDLEIETSLKFCRNVVKANVVKAIWGQFSFVLISKGAATLVQTTMF